MEKSMAIRMTFKWAPCAVALGLLAAPSVWAQVPPQTLERVSVSAKAAPVLDVDRADVGGWGEALARTPQSVSVLGADLLAATSTNSWSQAVKLDASLADSYNTTGYIESLSIRGFLQDQGNNFLRNGLAVSNYAPIALENKERVEVLKGVAGLQSGVSAPGGLVNFVTKVPLKESFTTVNFGSDEHGGSKLHLDANAAFGSLGVRVNLAAEGLASHFDKANGSREFASLALAWPLAADTSVSADWEFHHKRQPSVPGQGLLDTNGDGVGDTLPRTINPRLNLNNQDWSLPFEATSNTVQLALNHSLNTNWSVRLGLGNQETRIDDRIAFPDGCSKAVTYVYPGLCANGDVDIYDYRSEGEKRVVASWDARLSGTVRAAGLTHHVRLGMAGHNAQADLPAQQAYNYVGSTNIFAPAVLRSDATLSALNTNSSEHSTDAYAMVSTRWNTTMQTFAGVRVSGLNRSSARSDGSEAITLGQTVATPWAGVSWSPLDSSTWYASWGQGVEMESVPNRPAQFVNFGEALPVLKSGQTEVGVKWQAGPRLLVSAAVFSIDKPYADDLVDAGGLLRRVAGGKAARHRGLELSASGSMSSQWSIQASMTLLDATYTTALNPALVGQAVTNVPRVKKSLFSDYKLDALPGVSLNALLTQESGKTVTTDGSVELPSAWQLDAGAQWQTHVAGKSMVWRIQMENVTDRIYWREAPTQSWGGIYLFPSTPRTLRAGITIEL
jgi:iron complex outermembrane receptor protein